MAKKQNNLALGISDCEAVNSYLSQFEHPLIDLVHYLRKIIVNTHDHIGEGIFWNAPTFYYTGPMPIFDPKEYKRYIVGFIFNKKDCIRLVFLHGAQIQDPSGILEGNYDDGRRLCTFVSIQDVKNKEMALRAILLQSIGKISSEK